MHQISIIGLILLFLTTGFILGCAALLVSKRTLYTFLALSGLFVVTNLLSISPIWLSIICAFILLSRPREEKYGVLFHAGHVWIVIGSLYFIFGVLS